MKNCHDTECLIHDYCSNTTDMDKIKNYIYELCERYNINKPDIYIALTTDRDHYMEPGLIRIKFPNADFDVMYFSYQIFAQYLCILFRQSTEEYKRVLALITGLLLG